MPNIVNCFKVILVTETWECCYRFMNAFRRIFTKVWLEKAANLWAKYVSMLATMLITMVRLSWYRHSSECKIRYLIRSTVCNSNWFSRTLSFQTHSSHIYQGSLSQMTHSEKWYIIQNPESHSNMYGYINHKRLWDCFFSRQRLSVKYNK